MDNEISFQTKVISAINRHVILICVLLFAAYIFAQFLILSGIGTKGGEISAMRNQQEQLRLENEVLQSEIDKAKTDGSLQAGVNALGWSATGVEQVYVQVPPSTLVGSAQ